MNTADIQPRTIETSELGKKTLLFLLSPAICTILVLFCGGLFLGLLQALGHLPGAETNHLTLQHFKNVIQDPGFFESLGLTLYISLASTCIAAVLSLVLALMINSWAQNNTWIYFILQIPLAVPHLVIGIALIFLLAPSGLAARISAHFLQGAGHLSFPVLINDPWCIGINLVYIWKEVPFITFMLLSVLKNMGDELLEVGATLNAGRLQRFRHITLPILRPSLGASCCIVFAFTFGAFEIPFLLGRTYPLTLPVWAYKNFSDVDLLARPEGIGIGLIIAAIVIMTVLIAERILSRGGVKL